MKKKLKVRAGFTERKKERMLSIISDLKKKMAEIDRLKEDIEYKHISFSMSPKHTKSFIEEIKVPSIEIIRDEGAKKR